MTQKRQIFQMFLSNLISPSHKPTKRLDSPSPPSQITYALRGGFGGGHSPTQWGVWGSEPPDPDSVLTNNNRNPQVFIIYRFCLVQTLTLTGVDLGWEGAMVA
jgi:hypothetical protein